MDQNKRVTRSRTISTGSNSSIASNSSTNSVKRRLDPKELNSTIIHQEKFQKMAEKVDLTTLNEKLNILIKKLDSSDEKINLMQMTLNKLVNQVEIVEHRTTKLEKNVDIIFEQLNEFKGSQYHLHAEINTLQQANLKSSISIRGLPGNLPRDEAMKVIANLGAILGIPLTLADFSSQPYIVYHRDQKECHVVGTFNDLRTKITAMKNFKTNQPITVEDVCNGLSAESPFRGKKIFLKNLLTRNNQMLLHETRQHMNLFLYVWESNGRVLARRTSTSHPIFIRSSEHLQELISKIPAENGENARMETSQTQTQT